MKEARGWILVIGFLLIFGLTAFALVNTVRKTAESAVAPVSNMTGSLATQVAQFLHPTPTILPDPVTVIRDVRTLSRLETIQFTIEKVVTAERGQGSLEFLFGDELIFVAHGYVIAGVDLGKMASDDMWLEDGVLYVRLPTPEIFVATLDNDKSYVYDRDTGLFTRGDIYLETEARQAAEDEIETAALEDGILDQARVNAETYLSKLLNSLGYPDIIFEEPEFEG